MYRILTGEDDVIYDSSNKNTYPAISPAMDSDLNQAESLEFTILTGHSLYGQIQELKTFVYAKQDDDCLFYGRVLTIDKELFGKKRVYCEGALTFLSDSEMEPITVTETIADFFRRCVASHNGQVEERKQFTVGEIVHEKASTEMEFKIDSYIKTRDAIENSIIQKHGGYIRTRRVDNVTYIDYYQKNTHVNTQPIQIGKNVIDKNDHSSGENSFSILRPLGKNKLTIEGASSQNLFSGTGLVTGQKLWIKDTETIFDDADWCYSSAYMPVVAGSVYFFAPDYCVINFYDQNHTFIETYRSTGSEGNSVTAPTQSAYARISFPLSYEDRVVFKLPGQNLITSPITQGELLSSFDGVETVKASDSWCHTDMISVSPGTTYLAAPGAIYLNYYVRNAETQEWEVKSTIYPENDLGGAYITIPDDVSNVKISFPSRYLSTQRFELASGNLASRSGFVTGKKLYHGTKEITVSDQDFAYSPVYIDVSPDSFYTGDPTPFGMCFYDENKQPIFSEESDSEIARASLQSPENAKYARVFIPNASASSFILQKGQSLIRTLVNPGSKVIELPDRIDDIGRIIHTETFSDIDDAQNLYLAGLDFINQHAVHFPKTCEIGLIDFHLMNPGIERIDLGHVFSNIHGFDEPMTVGSMHKDFENVENDTITLKNDSELATNDAGSSSGSISTSYASSSRSEGLRYKSLREELDSENAQITKLFEIASRKIEIHGLEEVLIGTHGTLKLIAENSEKNKAKIDILTKSAEGVSAKISMLEDTINLYGYVKAKNLAALIGKIAVLQGLSAYFSGDVTVGGSVTAAGMYIGGSGGAQSLGAAVKSISSNSGAPTGQIGIQYIDFNGNSHTVNFSIADTQYYQDGVSAAYDEGWNAALDASSGELVRIGGNERQLYDEDLDVYVTALTDYSSGTRYTLPNRRQTIIQNGGQ